MQAGTGCGTSTNADCDIAANPKVCKCSAGYPLKDGVCSANGTISLSRLNICIVTQL